MRLNAKKAKRKIVPIDGEGMHSIPKLVFGGRFSGKVLKKADGTMPAERAKEVKKACEDYQKALKNAGIPILPARIQIVGSGKKRKVYFLQERFPSSSLLPAVLSRASKGQCAVLLNKLFSYVQKRENYNRGSGKVFTIDLNFLNWAVEGNELVFFDFYPPRVKKKADLDWLEIKRHESSIVRAGHLVLYPLLQRKKFSLARAIASIVGRAAVYRPDLREEFIENARKFVKKNLSGNERKIALFYLKNPEKLARPSLKGKIAQKLNARKRSKKPEA